jgi:DNA polymerase-1
MRQLIIDIESDGLDINGTIHCIGTKLLIDSVPQPTQCYTSHPVEGSDGSLNDFLNFVSTCDSIIHFNGCAFDIPYLEQFFQVAFNCPQLDLLILSKIMFTKDELIDMDRGIPLLESSQWGSYSLDAFGKRIGTALKSHHEDWSQLTPEMVSYCKQDIEVTYQLYQTLTKMDNYPPQHVIDLEQNIRRIISMQERYGFYFDRKAAERLNLQLLTEQIKIKTDIHKVLKPKLLPDGPPKSTGKPFQRKQYIPNPSYQGWTCHTPYRKPLKRLKSGRIRLPAKNKYKWFTEPHKIVYIETQGEYQPIKLTKFNPGSRNHIQLWLKDMYNWEPEDYTPTGNPKVDADTLEALPYPETAPLKRYLKLVKDMGQLSQGENSLLNLVGPDNRFHGQVDTLGAGTGRMTHCLHERYLIKTIEGYKHYTELQEGELVYTYDIELKQIVLVPLKKLNIYDTITGQISNGTLSFECTNNHRWLTSEGFKEAKSITIEDNLILKA